MKKFIYSLITAGLALLLAPQLTFASFSGSDASGSYTATQSTLTADDIVNIAPTGTRLGLSDFDDAEELLSDEIDIETIPPFTFYGTQYDNLHVSSNGYIYFGDDNCGNSYLNTGLPDTSGQPEDGSCAENNLIAGLWTDLDPSRGGDIYAEVQGTKIIIQFDSVRYGSGSGVVNFQYILDSDTGQISLNYGPLSSNSFSKTIGIENSTGIDGIEVLYNSDDLSSMASTKVVFTYDDQDGVAIEDDCNPVDSTQFNTYLPDADGDGEYDFSSPSVCAGDEIPTNYVSSDAAEDPNDSNSAITSNNIDGDIAPDDLDCAPENEDLFAIYYADDDEDGERTTDDTETICGDDEVPAGYLPTTATIDPDDHNPIATSTDRDADGIGNTEDCAPDNIDSFTTYYPDSDQDGERSATDGLCAGSFTPLNYLDETATVDPNDSNALMTSADVDGDGVANAADCSANDGSAFTTYYADTDGDGLGNASSTTCGGSTAPTGYVADSSDSDDTVSATATTETPTSTPEETTPNTESDPVKVSTAELTVTSIAASSTAGSIDITYSDDSVETVKVFSKATKVVTVKYLAKRDAYLIFHPTYKSVVVYKDGAQVDKQKLSKGGFKKGKASVVKVTKKVKTLAVRMNKTATSRVVLIKLNADKTSDNVLVKATGKKLDAKIKLKKPVTIKKVAGLTGRQVTVKTATGAQKLQLLVKKWKLNAI